MPNLSTAYNVSQCKQDLASVLHGTTINQVQGIDNIFNRAARQLLLDLDPQETIRIAQTPTLFNQVYDYSISNLPDLKGNKIIDVRPQVNRGVRDVFGQTYSQQFDVQKQLTTVPNFTINFNEAEKSLRIDATDIIAGAVINDVDVINGNGIWSVGGTASSLVENSINFVAPAGSSLQFNLAAGVGSQTGYITNSTITSLDLSAQLNLGTLFWWVYLPTGADFTSLSLSFGSSTSNYYTVSATTPWNGTSFINGWNLIGVPWLGASVTGTPDPTAITFAQLNFTYNGNAQTGVQANLITSQLGKIFEILYYSKYLFRDVSTGNFQETVTADDNLINLDTETFQVFFNLLAFLTVQQVSGGDMQADMTFFGNEYQKSLARYQGLYKSQLQVPQLTYYKTTKPGFMKYFGIRYP